MKLETSDNGMVFVPLKVDITLESRVEYETFMRMMDILTDATCLEALKRVYPEQDSIEIVQEMALNIWQDVAGLR